MFLLVSIVVFLLISVVGLLLISIVGLLLITVVRLLLIAIVRLLLPSVIWILLPSITSIVVLSRKKLPSSVATNPKVTVKILGDFLSYPDSLLQDLTGAEACIWYASTHMAALHHWALS